MREVDGALLLGGGLRVGVRTSRACLHATSVRVKGVSYRYRYRGFFFNLHQHGDRVHPDFWLLVAASGTCEVLIVPDGAWTAKTLLYLPRTQRRSSKLWQYLGAWALLTHEQQAA